MNALSTVARALGGDVVGCQALVPGPGHSKRDRSLSVRLSAMAPEGFVVHSHSGDDPMACRDYVRSRLGWDRPTRFGQDVAFSALQPRATEPDRAQLAKIENAQRIWSEACDPTGTLVEVYLRSRGLELPFEAAGETIRWHPRCPWLDNESGQTIRVPAMIAAMRSVADEQVTAVHRTRLTDDGRKVDRRMLGKVSGTAIMLTPFSAVGAGLALAEGIETALSAYELGWRSVWAMGSVGAIASFPVLTGLQSLVLCAETDDSGASSKAIQSVGIRYEDAGREVLVVTPNVTGDLNDVLREPLDD